LFPRGGRLGKPRATRFLFIKIEVLLWCFPGVRYPAPATRLKIALLGLFLIEK